MTSGRSVLVIAAGILGIVVLGAVVVLLAEGREPQSYEPGTPEAAMQAYLAAWDNDDPSAAYDVLSNAIKAAGLARGLHRPVRRLWRGGFQSGNLHRSRGGG